MKLNTELNYDALRRALVFANTPNFLYNHFRQERSVEEFAKRATMRELMDYFERAVKDKVENIDDLVTLYAVIIALTYKEYSPQLGEFFEHLDEYDFEWSAELKALCIARMTPTRIIYCSYYRTIGEPTKIISNHSTSHKKQVIHPKTETLGDSK